MFYAAHNLTNFSNYWDVYAFSTKSERDSFVEQESDRLQYNGNYVNCQKIKRKEISEYFTKEPLFFGRRFYIDWDQNPNEQTDSYTGGRIVQEYSYYADYVSNMERLNK